MQFEQNTNQCFHPNTIVYSERGPIEMKFVARGDRLFTVDGSLKKVCQVITAEVDGSIYNVENGMGLVKVMGQQEIYIQNGSELQHKQVQDLTTDDLMVFPIPKHTKTSRYGDDYCKFMGILIGHSSFYSDDGCWIDLRGSELALEFIHKFAKRMCIVVDYGNKRAGFRYGSPGRGELFLKKTKIMNPKLLHLPEEKLVCLLEGLFGMWDEKTHIFKCQKFVHQIKFMYLRLGILLSSKKCSGGYEITIPHIGDKGRNLMASSKITNIEKIDYRGPIINFKMENGHSYLTSAGVTFCSV